MKKRIFLFFESLRFALQAFSQNRIRTFLTLATITIGIFSIIGVLTFVSWMENGIMAGVSQIGDDMLYVQQMPWVPEDDGEYRFWDYIKRPSISFRNYKSLKDSKGIPAEVAFSASSSGTVEYFDGMQNASAENTNITLTSYDYYKVQPVNIAMGRYYTEMEARTGGNVVIIGWDIYRTLFGNKDPIGKTIKVKSRKVTVIGVLEREGINMMGMSKDSWVLMPVNYGRTIFDLERLQTVIMVSPEAEMDRGWVANVVRGRMRAIRRLRPGEKDNFALNESSMFSEGLEDFFYMMNLIGFCIGGFAILVGGFSIANIMFVSVKERTPLIGIQKSLGARGGFILTQFLIEAILLSIIGGIFGLFLVLILVALINAAGMEMSLGWDNFFLGVSISSMIGIIFGFFPALRAAYLDPVEAIRAN